MLWRWWDLSRAVFTIVQALRYDLNNTLLYFLQPFGPNPLVRPETKHSIWQGRLWSPRHSVHASDFVCADAIAWMCAHGVRGEELLPSKCQGQCVPISLAWFGGMEPLERNRVGRGRAREEGWKNGGEAQLAAASNWAEQVSMADQTHMQRGSKERVGHKQSSRAGEAAGAEEVGRRARGWSHSSSHSLFVTGGRERQLSPPYRNTHTPPCVVITLNSLNTQKITKKKPLIEQLL